MEEQTIVGLAILKKNWDSGYDYIQNFVPFLAECLYRATRDEVSLLDIQEGIYKIFGLKIPQSVLASVLKRAVRLEH